MAGTKRRRRENHFDSVGYGYIVVPSNVEKDEYIASCYGKERVCIMTEHSSSMVKDCYISKSALRDIVFPDISDGNKNKTGSAVVFVCDDYANKPTIVAVLSKEDESDLLEEFKFQLKKRYVKNTVLIEGDAKKGLLSINVEDGEDEGAINITVKGKTGGKINIKCQTEVNIETDEKINLHTTGEINLNTYNSANGELLSKFNISGTDVILIPQNELKIGEATEPVAMADSLADILGELIDKIGAATVSTLLGAQPLLNAADIIAVKGRLDEMKSLVTKTS